VIYFSLVFRWFLTESYSLYTTVLNVKTLEENGMKRFELAQASKRSTGKMTGAIISVVLGVVGIAPNAWSLDLNWSGQFRAETNRISNYAMDGAAAGASTDAARQSAGGYYIPGGGQKTAQFQTLFMRLKPSAIVNDNVAIHTELWFGNPVTGFYGSGFPDTTRSDLRQYNSSFSGGASISAQRFWADLLTDFGMVQVGRAPMHWGLGLVHHSGDGLWDRYQSTGDVIRLSSKFGNFTVLPAFSKFNYGNAVGGANECVSGTCTTQTGGGGLAEYSLGLKYKNTEEDMEGGVNFIRRIGGAVSQGNWLNNVTTGGINMTIWDIYAQKRVGNFEFKTEAPLFSGSVLGTPYKAYALAVETQYHFNDAWSLLVKGGRVPGQQASPTATTPKWNMVYLNPNYRLGMFMFNYQLRNFAGPNSDNSGAASTKSIYDNPITNSNYLQVGGSFKTDKWTFHLDWFTAQADEKAIKGQYFFNSWDRKYVLANGDQSGNLGMEIDFGTSMDWDEFTTFGLDFGWYMPGKYYAFSNDTTTETNATDNVFGIQAKVGIKF
jgi:hypothetical protein